MDESKIIAEGKIDLGRVYLEIEGDTPTPVLEEKSVTITTNTDTLVEPSEGYDGMSSVTVTTNVQPNLETIQESITVNGELVIEPSEGYDGISSVELNVSVPAGIDFSEYGFQDTPGEINKMVESCESILNSWEDTNTSLDYHSDKSIYLVPYIYTNNVTTVNFSSCSNLTQVADLDYTNVTTFYRAFYSCGSLVTAPNINFSNMLSNSISCEEMFSYCTYLINVPIYNMTKVSNVNSMFSNCKYLTDTALDNILQSLITCTQQQTKTLYAVGFYGSIPSGKWSTLPHYNAFTSAGWRIGY